ncbi:MAG: protein-glutamate O-methyltransferase CheR [Gammaproteobacteria bacterium]|nr:protein-glutamate O-methyltransferase CheR [Gammaproteobacteria bacterium]MDH5802654.1 protein-glutamate O-methyltransferase CheR [Gammaproteobacteria bacterium]
MIEKDREFHFTSKDFNFIRSLVAQETGIALSEAKSDMVYSRLSRRLRSLNIEKFTDYLDMLKDRESDELVNFINAITTNLTSFFREKHHFDYLSKTVFPEIFKHKTEKRIRIWSAGCSTGEEPYTLAMVLREALPKYSNWDAKILATDLDSNVVTTAKNGVYREERVDGMSKSLLTKYFNRSGNGSVTAKPELKELITFKQLNLMHDWPMRGPFDFIFCRNVVIYFNKETQRKLFERYADLTVPDGYLFIGHSESLFKVCDRYKLIGNTIYKKIK